MKTEKQFQLTTLVIACVLLVMSLNRTYSQERLPGLRSSNSQSEPSSQPVNRLGAHFDQSHDANSLRRENFQSAVAQTAGTYYSPNRRASEETKANPDNNPGLPLGSAGQQQFGSPTNEVSATNRQNTFTPQVRNVAYGISTQDNNSFGSLTPNQIPDNQQKREPFGQTTREDYSEVTNCSVLFIDDIELPAQESGQIKTLFVKEGDAVAAGKVVGQIDDELFRSMQEQAKLRVAIAEQKATDSTSVMAAENEISLAGVDYRRTQDLAGKGSKPQSELEKAEFTWKLAMLKKKAAQNEKDSANGESKIEKSKMAEVETKIHRHIIVSSDFDGYVIEIFRHPLEWVNAGEKVMRVARMDRLWVQGVVSARDLNPYEAINRPVTVTLELARGETTVFQGKIVNVGLERQGTTNFLVKAEIENRPIQGHWVLQPGSDVTMKIDLDIQPSNSAALDSKQVPVQKR